MQISDLAKYVYHVTVGDQKRRLSLHTKTVEQLQVKIRQEFELEKNCRLRLQIEDTVFPGEWTDLKLTDDLPKKATISAVIG